MKKLLITVLSLFAIVTLTACSTSTTTPTRGTLSETHLVVGVTSGPHEEIMEKVKEIAARDG